MGIIKDKKKYKIKPLNIKKLEVYLSLKIKEEIRKDER